MKAIWNNQVIAESNETKLLERNHYFPESSIKSEFFIDSDTKTTCFWKGEASYKSIKVGGEINPDAAWYYPSTKDAAKEIEGYYAFWNGVKIEK